jgi:hypothetical protein
VIPGFRNHRPHSLAEAATRLDGSVMRRCYKLVLERAGFRANRRDDARVATRRLALGAVRPREHLTRLGLAQARRTRVAPARRSRQAQTGTACASDVFETRDVYVGFPG